MRLKGLKLWPYWPVIAVAIVSGAVVANHAGTKNDRLDTEGVVVDFKLEPTESVDESRATFTLTNAMSGEPVTGARPLGWMSLRTDDSGVSNQKKCRQKIKTFLAGMLSAQAEVDMNSYTLWALNSDDTITVINPQISFSRTKLQGYISLPGKAADWAVHPNGKFVYVTIPGKDALLVVDTKSYGITKLIHTGKEPARVKISPDGGTVWIGNDGSVSVVEAREHELLRTITTAKGHLDLAFTEEGRHLWVVGSKSAEAVVIDTFSMEIRKRVALSKGITSVAVNPATNTIYFANSQTGKIFHVEQSATALAKSEQLRPGISALGVDHSGRWLFVLNSRTNSVTIMDATGVSSGGAIKPVHVLEGFNSPAGIDFTRNVAYVRNLKSNTIFSIDLNSISAEQRPEVTSFQAGKTQASKTARTSLASPLVPTPEGDAVLVASSADQALYFHAEAGSSPALSHSNYGHSPLATLFVNKALTEVKPGVYSVAVRTPQAGSYDVEFLLEQPRVATCLRWELAKGSASAKRKTDLALVAKFNPARPLSVNQSTDLRFQILSSNGPTAVDVGAVSVLILQFPAGRQWRMTSAVDSRGRLRVKFNPPDRGHYKLLVSVPSLSVPFGQIRPVDLYAED